MRKSITSPARIIRFGLILLTLVTLGLTAANAQSTNVVTYVGKTGNGIVNKEYFQNAWVVLSSNPTYDSTVVVMGAADNLDWLPAGLPTRTLGNTTNLNSSSGSLNSNTTGQNYAFLLHMSKDMETPLSLIRFPINTAHDINRLRTTTVPNENADNATVYISGRRAAPGNNDGYYIARLDYNFTTALPAAVNTTWLYNVDCFQTDDEHEVLQPWDVQNDGKVVYTEGQTMVQSVASRCFIKRLKPNGTPDLVRNWFYHYQGNNGFQRLRAIPGDQYSAIIMKCGNVRGALRSPSQRLFDTTMVDENNNPGRKGAYPDDFYYDGPSIPGGTNGNNGGYLGYVHDNRTHRVGSIVIDKRSNDMYIGYCVKTNLPSGLGDFEPALVAMDSSGRQKWWRRLYQETIDLSPPDQWVDALEIDYFNNQVVVIARAAGNNVENFFAGTDLYYNPTARSYQNGFTGTGGGSALVSWIGKYTLDLGRIMHATYLAEFSGGTGGFGAIQRDPNMDGWYDPNSGWISLNTTLCQYNKMHISRGGSVCITGIGRRVVTTKTAHQKMLKPDRALPLDSLSAWSWFARVYSADLASIRYSTLMTGVWDPRTQRGSDNTNLACAVPILNGIVVVGQHRNAETGTPASLASRPNTMPTTNRPAWTGASSDSAYGQTAIMAKLAIPPQRIKPLVAGQTFCRRLLTVVAPNWVEGAVPLSLPGDYAYNPNNEFTVSLIDSNGNVISDSTVQARNLRTLSLSIPPWAPIAQNYKLTISASSPFTGGDTVTVAIADGPPDQPFPPFGNTDNLCLTGTSVFKTYRVPFASSYRWKLSNNDAGTASGSDTVGTIYWDPTYNSDNDPVKDTVSVYLTALNQCGESLGSQRLFVTLTNACLTVGSGIANGTFCPLTNLNVPVTAPTNTVFKPGNQFMVQVSDADGNFGPVAVGGGDIIGVLNSPLTDSTGIQINQARKRIPCFLPFGLAGPTRIRIVSTNPALLGGEVTINVNVLAEPPTQPYFIPGYGKITNGRLDTNYPSNISATDNQGSGINICSFGNQQDRPGGCQQYPATSPFGCGSYRSMIYVTNSVQGALSYKWTIDPPEAGIIQGFAGVDTACIVTWDTLFAGGPVSIYVTTTTDCIGLSSVPLIVNVNNCAPIRSASNSFNADTSFCAGATFPVNIPLPSYAPPAIAAPRELLIQLSDQNGSFLNPILVGSINSVTLPASLPSSNNYRLRVWGGTTDANGGLSRGRPRFYGNPIRIRVFNPLTAPGTPSIMAPLGAGNDSVCTIGSLANPRRHLFSTAGVAGAKSYRWTLIPSNAGTIQGVANKDTVSIVWTPGFIGTAYVSVRGVNVCGPGATSGLLAINLGYKGAPGSPCGIPIPLEVVNASYRTKATGSANWSAVSNWERCPTGNCPVNAPDLTNGWVAATVYPHGAIASQIIVRNYVTVDIGMSTGNGNRYASRFRVEPTGTLDASNFQFDVRISSATTFTENFASVTEGSTPPSGWTVMDADNNNVDAVALCNIGNAGINDDNPTGTTIQCGGNCLGKSSWFGRGGAMLSSSFYANGGVADDWLISPTLSISTNNFFYWQGSRFGRNNLTSRCTPCATNCGAVSFDPVRYEVRVFTTDPSGLAADPFTLLTNSTFAGVYTESGNSQTFRNISLAQYAGRNIWVAFRNISNQTGLLAIDNISLGAPTTVDFDLAGRFVNGSSTFNGIGGDILNTTTPIKGIVRSTGTFIHNRDGGQLPIVTWEAGSTLDIRGVQGNFPGNMSNQSFYNLTWNGFNQNRDMTFNEANPAPNGFYRLPALQSGGKLKVNSTGNGTSTLFITASTAFAVAYSKIEVTGGRLSFAEGVSGLQPMIINDSLIIRGGTFHACNDFRPYRTTINLPGHLYMTGGTYDCSGGSNIQFWLNAFTHQLNLGGDFIMEGGTFKQSFQGALRNSQGVTDRIRSQVIFGGNRLQKWQSNGTIEQQGIEFVLENKGAGLQLLSDVNVPNVRRVSWDGGSNFFPTKSFTHRSGNIDLGSYTLRTANYVLGSTGYIGGVTGSGTGSILADTITMGGIIGNQQDRVTVMSGAALALQGTADSNSYFIGGLKRSVTPVAAGGNYIWPVGTSTKYKGMRLNGVRTNSQPMVIGAYFNNSGATDAAPDRLRPFTNLAHWAVTRTGNGIITAIGSVNLLTDSLDSQSRIGQDTNSTTGTDPDAIYSNLGGNRTAANVLTNEKRVFRGPFNSPAGTTFFTIAKPGYMPAAITIGNTGTYKNLTEFSLDYNSLELNQPVTASFLADYNGDSTNTEFPEVFPIVFKQNAGNFPCRVVNPTNANLVTAGRFNVNAEVTFDGVDNLIFEGNAGGGSWRFTNRKTAIAGPTRNFLFQNDATFNTLKGLKIEAMTSIPPFPKVVPRGSCPFTKLDYEIKNLYNPSIAFYVPCRGLSNKPYPYSNNPLPSTGLAQGAIIAGNKWNSTLPAPDGDGDTSYNGKVLEYNRCADGYNTDPDYRPEYLRNLVKPINPGYTCDCLPNPSFPRCPTSTPNCNYASDYRSQNQQNIDCSPATSGLPANLRPPCPVAPDTVGMMARWQRQWARWIVDSTTNSVYVINFARSKRRYDSLDRVIRSALYQLTVDMDEAAVYIAGSTRSGDYGNSYNTIDGCSISGTNTDGPKGELRGYSYGILSQKKDFAPNLNMGNRIVNNNIYDFRFRGIDISEFGNGGNWNIEGNSIYNTNPGGCRFSATATAIRFVPGGQSELDTIANNYIGGTAPLAGGPPMVIPLGWNLNAIDMNVGGGPSAPSFITGNQILNVRNYSLGYPEDQSGGARCIQVSAGVVNVDRNKVGRLQDTLTLGNMDIVYNNSNSRVTINDNQLVNINSVLAGIRYVGTGAVEIKNNVLDNLKITEYGSLVLGIYLTPNTSNIAITDNSISRMGYSNSSKAYGIWVDRNSLRRSSSGIIARNRISNFSLVNPGDGNGGEVYGINLSANTAGATGWMIYNNAIQMSNRPYRGLGESNRSRNSFQFGIVVDSVANGRVGVIHNTVLIYGLGRVNNYGFLRKGQTTADLRVRNNILYNQRSGFAIGTNRSFDWAPAMSNYNLLGVIDTNLTARYGVGDKSYNNWISTSQGDANSWAITTDRNAPTTQGSGNYLQLFNDPDAGDLSIKRTDSTAWFVNTLGAAGPEGGQDYIGDAIKFDINGTPRSADSPVGYLSRWGADLGAFEVLMDSTVRPPASFASIASPRAVPQGTLQNFFFAGRKIGQINWDETPLAINRPTSVALRYLPGVDPANTIVQRRYFFARYDVMNASNNGRPYSFKLGLNYDKNVMARVEQNREGSIKVARNLAGSQLWKVYQSTANMVLKQSMMTDTTKALGRFALTDSIDQLPNVRIDTVEICNNTPTRLFKTPRPIYDYTWTYAPAVGVARFDSLNPNPLITIARPQTGNGLYRFVVIGKNPFNPQIITYDTLMVRVLFPPIPLVGNKNVSICSDISATIGVVNDPLPRFRYRWRFSPGIIGDSLTPITTVFIQRPDTLLQQFTAILTKTDTVTGCTGSDTVFISALPRPVVDLGVDSLKLCGGSPGNLGGLLPRAGYSYQWSPATDLSSATVARPSINITSPGTYKYVVLVTNANTSCTNKDSIYVKVFGLPPSGAGLSRRICNGDTTTLGLTNPDRSLIYSWSPTTGLSNPNSPNPVVRLTNTGNACQTTSYTLTVTEPTLGCLATSRVDVEVCPRPVADAGLDKVVCSDDIASIGSTGVTGLTYHWTGYPALGADSSLASPAIRTRYRGSDTLRIGLALLVTNASGCISTDSVTVKVLPEPVVSAGPDRGICATLPTTLGAASVTNIRYAWSPRSGLNDSTIAEPTFRSNSLVRDTVQYILKATNTLTGCVGYDTVSVIIKPLPIPNLGRVTRGCSRDTIRLGDIPTVGLIYSWTALQPGGQLLSPTSFMPIVIRRNRGISDSVYQYRLLVTDTAGCSALDTLDLTISPEPNSIAGADRTVCDNGTTTLGRPANPNETYQWSGTNLGSLSSTSAAAPVFSAVNSGTVLAVDTIVVKTTHTTTGCTSTDTVLVSVQPKVITPIITQRTLTLCPGTTGVTFGLNNAVAGYQYTWRMTAGRGTITGTGPSVTANFGTQQGQVWAYVSATNNGCAGGTDSVAVNLNSVLRPVIQSNQPSICSYEASQFGLTLRVDSVPGSRFRWRTNTLAQQVAGDSTFRARFLFSSVGVAKIWLEEQNGACRGLSDTISITIYPSPDSTKQIAGPLAFCENIGAPVRYAFPITPGRTLVNWTVPQGLQTTTSTTADSSFLTILSGTQGRYKLVVQESDTVNGAGLICLGRPISFTLNINPKPLPVLANYESVICQQDTVTKVYAVANAVGGNTYVWRASGGTIVNGAGTGSVTVRWVGTQAPFSLFVRELAATGCQSDELAFGLRLDSTTIALDYITFAEARDTDVELYVRTTSGRLNAGQPVLLQRTDSTNNWQTVRTFGLGYTGLITDDLTTTSGRGLRYRLAATNGCNIQTFSAIHNTIWMQGKVSGNDAVFSWNPYPALTSKLQVGDLLRRKDDEQNLVPYAMSFNPQPLTYKVINNGPDGFNQQFRLNVSGPGVNVYSNKVDLYYENPIKVYNVWTPNNDNQNDHFTIENLSLYANNEVVILNRYGVEVFKATNYRNDFKGENLAAGTYFYRVTVAGKPGLNGWVEVLK